MKLVIVWIIVFVLLFVAHVSIGNELEIVFLDVGQGDSILVKTPSGKNILIDGGADDSVLSELAVVMLYFERIDYVLVTHADSDHLAGIYKVKEYYDTGKVYLNMYPEQNRLIKWWSYDAISLYQGEKWGLDGVSFSVLWPTLEYLETNPSPNNGSIVIKLEYNDFCAIFTGDIEKQVEARVLEMFGDDVGCELLKVPHHGSNSSSTEEFIDAVGPNVAVVSVGEGNRYGHPKDEIIERYESRGIVVLRTDELGRIAVKTDGFKVSW